MKVIELGLNASGNHLGHITLSPETVGCVTNFAAQAKECSQVEVVLVLLEPRRQQRIFDCFEQPPYMVWIGVLKQLVCTRAVAETQIFLKERETIGIMEAIDIEDGNRSFCIIFRMMTTTNRFYMILIFFNRHNQVL